MKVAERILIVHSKWDTLNLLKRLITEKTEYEVDITNDPLQATTLLRDKSFDVVITGLKMPGKSGL
ncbi:MAG TPA: response regulator, partial [Syntrophaceae bacterium]|nr:response regulator [Syntrophaceae bacterium]